MNTVNGRIRIAALRVLAKDKMPAEVTFGSGFNVISGASNTGKSYILQCIDFALGSSKPPKAIEASAGYETVQLELINNANERFSLERSLKGGDARVSATDSAGRTAHPRVLGEKHQANDPATISGFLLQQLGLWGAKVRIDKEGKLRTLSFRDLARLIIVDETQIISEESPVLTGQYILRTAETSVFNFLLSGVDDSSIVAAESRQQRRRRLKEQINFLTAMIDRSESDLTKLDEEPQSLEKRKDTLEEQIKAHREEVSESTERISEQEKIRRDAWASFQRVESQRSSNEEMLARFQLLQKHYTNDIARLQAIVEADHFFTQLRQERCPLCGAPPEAHDPAAACRPESLELANLRDACVQEMEKINLLLRDLVGTTTALTSDTAKLRDEASGHRQTVRQAGLLIKESLEPKAVAQQMELEGLYRERLRVGEAYALLSRIREMRDERDECESALSARIDEPAFSDKMMSQPIEQFTLTVESLLKDWAYPGLSRVTFSEEDTDLIISGRRRATEGKGLRAISHAAFVIGLMFYCQKAERHHPGFVVLDSPLVTYKRRDVQPGEAIPDDVKSSFFAVLSDMSSHAQVIVLENEDPPVNVQDKINYVHFSRSRDIGRYGFFPVNSGG
jgi:AAA15 family ATPase/GTPase